MEITFNHYPHVIAAMSERGDGSMIWGNHKPVDLAVLQNRNTYFEKRGVDPKRVVAGGCMRGTHVAIVTEQEAGEYLLNTDALITQEPNLFLAITAADCMPVFYVDPVVQSVGIAHAGWQGLVGGVLENVIVTLEKTYGSKAKDIQVVIGPHIRSCHFEVDQEFSKQFDVRNAECREGRFFVDLAGEAKLRLESIGVKEITTSSVCTSCEEERFFSARRDKIKPLQGMLAFIGWKK